MYYITLFVGIITGSLVLWLYLMERHAKLKAEAAVAKSMTQIANEKLDRVAKRVRDSLCGHSFGGPPQPVVGGLFVFTEPFALQCQDGLNPRHIPELLAAFDSLAESFHA